MIFAGLGCPNGCDFCCTSHFFKRKHIRLLPPAAISTASSSATWRSSRGCRWSSRTSGFSSNREACPRAAYCVIAGGRALSIFAFASVKAISQYTVTEILEMGIDGFWIGYEGTRSGYAKQDGRPVPELFRELREHGISILTSMIVGLPYQTPAVIERGEVSIFGPVPASHFHHGVRRPNAPSYAQ